VVGALAAVLIVAPNAIDPLLRATPPDDASVRADVATVWRHAQSGEPVYIFSLDVPRWTFYTTDWAHPDTTRLDRLLALADSLGPNSGNRPPRGHPVRDDGRPFVVRTETRTELLGLPTGVEILNDGPTHSAADPGWATTEADRVRAATTGSAWLIFLHGRSFAAPLADTLIADQGRLTDSLIVPHGIIAYRYARMPDGVGPTDGATGQTPARPAPDRAPTARATPPP
jgi:hypothetical protein